VIRKIQRNVSWLAAGMLVGSLGGGVAVAKIIIPPHSVSYSSLSRGLQRKISQPNPLSPIGEKGEKGDTGALGLQGGPYPSGPRAYGLVSPWLEELPLSRSSNAVLIRPEGGGEGIWCIEAKAINTNNLLVQVSPADEPHVSVGGNEVPVVRWHVVPSVCEANQVEIETGIVDLLEGEYERTNLLPFTFIIEESENL